MKLRIAIIEDEYYTRQAIRKYIEKLGDPYEFCGEARDGKEGLELLRSQKPDVALVDITMPVMNGLDMMQQAYDENLPTHMVILTGYSDFSYARAAVRLGVDEYLLKPLRIEDLRRTLEHVQDRIARMSPAIPEGIAIENLLSSQLAEQLTRNGADSADTAVLLEHLQFPRDTGTYAVALIEFHKESGMPQALRLLTNQTTRTLRESGFPVVGYHADVHTICLVIHVSPSNTREAMIAALQSGSNAVLAQIGGSLKIALSCDCHNLSMIHDAYLEAQIIQQYYVFSRGQTMALYTSENLICSPSSLFDSKMRHNFSMMLHSREIRNIQAFINERFDALRAQNANATAVYLCAAEIMSAILEYSAAYGDAKSDAEVAHSMLPSLFSIKQIDALQTFITRQALSAIAQSEADKNAHSMLIRRIHAYIDQNFSNSSLRLEDVARANYISTQYLCSVYRKTTGNTVGDYIFDVRMRQAQRLIEEGQRNVTAVSESCGYEDPNYFSKCFRKKFGMTPKQYIDSHTRQ